jgi:hypothetical protein
MTWEACYATPVQVEAHVVKGFLEQYGVPCVLADGRFAAQPLTFCALGQVRVLVPSDWITVARGLIRGRQQRRRRRHVRPADALGDAGNVRGRR